MVRLIPQGRLELGKAPRPAEIHLIHAGELVILHEIIIGQNGRVLGPGGDDPDDIGGDGGGVVALEDTDPLVALLHVEPAQVFITPDGVPDSLPQVGLAQVHPFGGKFRIRLHQREKIGRKGGAPPLCFGAGNLVHGDFLDSHIHLSGYHGIV